MVNVRSPFFLGIYSGLYLCLALWLTGCVYAAVPSGSIAATQGGTNAPASVEINRYVPALRYGHESLYRLSFNYAFSDDIRVFLGGLGELSPKGSLSYLTADKTLTFTDARGAVLEQVDLKVIGTPEGARSNMPALDDFPPEYQSFTRVGRLSLEQCNTVLNEFFDGYRPRVEQGVTYYVTTYRTIGNPPPNKVARMAFQVSTPFPAEGDTTRTSFRIQTFVQEQGQLSPDPAKVVSEQTMKEVYDLRKQVVDRLMMGMTVQ